MTDLAPTPRPPFDRFDLTGRVALVTGGTRGLGRAIVRALAGAGADIVVSSRKGDACEETAAEVRGLGRRALAYCCHVGHWDELEGLVDAAYEAFGRVDVLVNNAGLAPTYPNPQGVTEELWDKTLGVNLKGPFRLTALVGERMVAGDGGSIVNTSSIGGVRPTRDILPYAAAKAGLNALTIGFADALGPKVRVNAVMPGPFQTDISRNWDHEAFAERARTFPLRRAGEPEEIAAAVLYFASDASSFTTGAVLAVDGGAQWSLAGGGDQATGYQSIYDGKRDWS
ncbi:MAG TPA: SDR family oxidoreductase [Gaiellaceae bacterium]|jgi:NAD(P)-dependent dehydrogenase (short-subunit alcohol dehydrogenase family)